MPRQTLEQIVSNISVVYFAQERYYNVLELLERLERIGEEELEQCNVILTPYYVDQGRRLELCWAEVTLTPPVSFAGKALADYCAQRLLSKETQEEINAVACRDGLGPFEPGKLYVSYWDIDEERFK